MPFPVQGTQLSTLIHKQEGLLASLAEVRSTLQPLLRACFKSRSLFIMPKERFSLKRGGVAKALPTEPGLHLQVFLSCGTDPGDDGPHQGCTSQHLMRWGCLASGIKV